MQYVSFFRYTNTRVPKIIVYQNVLVHILLFFGTTHLCTKKMVHIDNYCGTYFEFLVHHDLLCICCIRDLVHQRKVNNRAKWTSVCR